MSESALLAENRRLKLELETIRRTAGAKLPPSPAPAQGMGNMSPELARMRHNMNKRDKATRKAANPRPKKAAGTAKRKRATSKKATSKKAKAVANQEEGQEEEHNNKKQRSSWKDAHLSDEEEETSVVSKEASVVSKDESSLQFESGPENSIDSDDDYEEPATNNNSNSETTNNLEPTGAEEEKTNNSETTGAEEETTNNKEPAGAEEETTNNNEPTEILLSKKKKTLSPNKKRRATTRTRKPSSKVLNLAANMPLQQDDEPSDPRQVETTQLTNTLEVLDDEDGNPKLCEDHEVRDLSRNPYSSLCKEGKRFFESTCADCKKVFSPSVVMPHEAGYKYRPSFSQEMHYCEECDFCLCSLCHTMRL